MIRNTGELIQLFETVYTDRVAVRWVDPDTEEVRSVSYTRLATYVRACITMLQEHIGALKGQHIAFLAKNSYPYLVYILSVLSVGGVLIPLNPQKSKEEIQYELKLSDASVLIHDDSFFVREGDDCLVFSGMVLPLEDKFEAELYQGSFDQDDQVLAMLIFTSGTTGRSKGVMLSQESIFRNTEGQIRIGRQIQLSRGHDIHEHISDLCVLPFYHVANGNVFYRLAEGNTVHLCLDLKYLYRDLEKMPSDSILVVPAILKNLHHKVTHGKASKLGKLKIISVCGAMANEAIMREMANEGYFLGNIYGLTELYSSAHNVSQKPEDLCSVGQSTYGYEAKTLDGELCFRGAGMLLGYYHDSELTKQVIDSEGWFHTGDLASIDDRGTIRLTGRKKNLIILDSGENVSPEELEALLEPCGDITEAIVKEYQGSIAAEIYSLSGKKDSISLFIKNLNEQLPKYKQIAKILFRDTPLEKTSTGKIKRGV